MSQCRIVTAATLSMLSLAITVPATQAWAAPRLAVAPLRTVLADRTADEIATVAHGALRAEVEQRPLAAAVSWRLLAELVGSRSGVDAGELATVWSAISSQRRIVMAAALAQVGVPYVRNGEDPAIGFDCSGLTRFAFRFAGIELAHQSEAQIGAARRVQQPEAGDLIHWPGHILMSLGVHGLAVHASTPGEPVNVTVVTRRAVSYGVVVSDEPQRG